MRLPQLSLILSLWLGILRNIVCSTDWVTPFSPEFAPWLGVSTYHVVSITHCFPGPWWGFFRIVAGSVFYVFYSFNQLSHQRNMRIVFRFLDSLEREGEGQWMGRGRGIDSRKVCWWWHQLPLPLSLSRRLIDLSQWHSTDCHIIFLLTIPSPSLSYCLSFFGVWVCVLILARVAPSVSPPSWPG